MIATEAAAEGINLQFCSLVVNYDLPWNPQRIEQRIGRCHRYGQKYDVVVVNFLNVNNEADCRVFDILEKKLKLFEGVFGASDEVLGAIESGVDFERRIAQIYQNCRTSYDIQREFDFIQEMFAHEIGENMRNDRRKLLENFDAEVEKLESWSNDRKNALEIKLKEMDKKIRELKKTSRQPHTLEEKIELQRQQKTLDTERMNMRRKLFEAQDAIDAERDKLIKNAEKSLQKTVKSQIIFAIDWRIV